MRALVVRECSLDTSPFERGFGDAFFHQVDAPWSTCDRDRLFLGMAFVHSLYVGNVVRTRQFNYKRISK